MTDEIVTLRWLRPVFQESDESGEDHPCGVTVIETTGFQAQSSALVGWIRERIPAMQPGDSLVILAPLEIVAEPKESESTANSEDGAS